MNTLAENPATLPSGHYTWDLPSGGTAGHLTMHATVQAGRVTEWYSVSGDGRHAVFTPAEVLAEWGHNYGHALRSEIDHRLKLSPLGLSLPPVEFKKPAPATLSLSNGLGGVVELAYSTNGRAL